MAVFRLWRHNGCNCGCAVVPVTGSVIWLGVLRVSCVNVTSPIVNINSGSLAIRYLLVRSSRIRLALLSIGFGRRSEVIYVPLGRRGSWALDRCAASAAFAAGCAGIVGRPIADNVSMRRKTTCGSSQVLLWISPSSCGSSRVLCVSSRPRNDVLTA